MIQLDPTDVTPALLALFRKDDPQARRCFGVLAGTEPKGKIFSDNPADPTWGAVWENYDGTLFLAGAIDSQIAEQLFTHLQSHCEVLLLLEENDPRFALAPSDHYYDGYNVELYARPLGMGLGEIINQLPPDLTLRRLDRDLIMRTQWGPDDVATVGGIDEWEATSFGYALMQGDHVLCEATVGAPAIGLREPGLITHEDHRGKGYGTITAARLIQEIESLGDQSYWNCAKQNQASIAVARKLGYRVEREYRCVAWKQQNNGVIYS